MYQTCPDIQANLAITKERRDRVEVAIKELTEAIIKEEEERAAVAALAVIINPITAGPPMPCHLPTRQATHKDEDKRQPAPPAPEPLSTPPVSMETTTKARCHLQLGLHAPSPTQPATPARLIQQLRLAPP